MMNNMVTKKKKVIVIPATKKKVTEEKNEQILNVAAYARVSTDDPEQLTLYEAQIPVSYTHLLS